MRKIDAYFDRFTSSHARGCAEPADKPKAPPPRPPLERRAAGRRAGCHPLPPRPPRGRLGAGCPLDRTPDATPDPPSPSAQCALAPARRSANASTTHTPHSRGCLSTLRDCLPALMMDSLMTATAPSRKSISRSRARSRLACSKRHALSATGGGAPSACWGLPTHEAMAPSPGRTSAARAQYQNKAHVPQGRQAPGLTSPCARWGVRDADKATRSALNERELQAHEQTMSSTSPLLLYCNSSSAPSTEACASGSRSMARRALFPVLSATDITQNRSAPCADEERGCSDTIHSQWLSAQSAHPRRPPQVSRPRGRDVLGLKGARWGAGGGHTLGLALAALNQYGGRRERADAAIRLTRSRGDRPRRLTTL